MKLMILSYKEINLQLKKYINMKGKTEMLSLQFIGHHFMVIAYGYKLLQYWRSF